MFVFDVIRSPLKRVRARRSGDGGLAGIITNRPGRVLIVTASVGAGHDGAARELARRLRQQGVDVVVRDYLDALPRWGRFLARDCYAPVVQHAPKLFEWLFRSIERKPAARAAALTFCRFAARETRRWTYGIDVVVSTYPLASQTLGDLSSKGFLFTPIVTFVTDPSTHWLWCHPNVDIHLCVTEATAADGRRFGVELQATGPLTEPCFARPVPTSERDRKRRSLGVEGDEPIALISSGSLGIGRVPETVRAVLRHPRARALVLCGQNEGLRRAVGDQDRVITLGWRDDVPELMAAADILVHNAGGLSFTEALVAGLPAVTYLPVPGHGNANAGVLAASGLAPWPQSPAELSIAIENAIAPGFSSRQFRGEPRHRDATAVVTELIGRETPHLGGARP